MKITFSGKVLRDDKIISLDDKKKEELSLLFDKLYFVLSGLLSE